MKKIIKDVTPNIKQITIVDERWYIKTDEKTLVETCVPSVTWITHYYPKGKGFENWLAKSGMDETEAIKQAARDKGSKVHSAIVDLIDGKIVSMDSQYINPSNEEMESLSLEEYECLMSFSDWFHKVKPIPITREIVVFNAEFGYAGTVDFICEIEGETWLIDFKTSQSVYPSHELQVAAYKYALEGFDNVKLGILQLGYRKNKLNYKFTEIKDQFDLFLSIRNIWKKETEGTEPFKKDYPISLKLEASHD